MAGKHLNDPLDYLYEELSPKEMAGMRRHLADCPECRTEIRTVRETVKLYRQANKPTPPAGLAARAAARALEAAKSVPEAEPVTETAVETRPEIAPTVQSLTALTDTLERALLEQRRKISQESLDAEYGRIREDVLGELKRRNWRSWLFHPAWTVAASVIFICALLIHISPRMNRTEVLYLPANYSRDGGATRQIRERERLPAAEPLAREAVPQTAVEPPPILREAEIMNQDAALPPPPPVAMPAQAPRAAPAPAPAAPASASSVSAPEPEPESWKAATEYRGKRAQGAEPLGEAKPEAPPLQLPAPVEESEPMLDAAMPALSDSGDDVAAGEADSAPPIPEAPSGGPVIVDMLQMEPPQLIARPTPVNVPERIQSLTTLAALQMANNEFEDAWKSIHMLERYDRDAARALAEVLLEMERTALADPASGEDAPEPEAVPPPAPADEPTKEPEVEPVEEPAKAPEEKTEAETREEELFAPVEPAPPAEPVQPAPAPVPEPVLSVPVPEPAPAPEPVPEPEPPVVLVSEHPMQMVEVLGEPPIDPPLTVVRVPASMLPPTDQQWFAAPVPIPELPSAPLPAMPVEEPADEAPATENRVEELAEAEPIMTIVTERMKARTGAKQEAKAEKVAAREASALPPAASEPALVQPAAPLPSQPRTPSPRRRPFSTDPYIRGY